MMGCNDGAMIQGEVGRYNGRGNSRGTVGC
jgi:hypothetical protein